MRQTRVLLLAGALASSSAGVAASLPRGVSPEFARFYESKATFACIRHPDIVLDAAQVNDGSCDCPDGSDEPGTAACAYLDPRSPPQPLPGSPSGTTNTTPALPGFWCANVGHVGAYVPFSYVNDGVCDYDLCCDGSDEYAHKGGVQCANRCAAVGKAFRRAEEERRQSRERALARRRTLAQEAARLRAAVAARVQALRGEIGTLEAARDRLQAALAEAERAERGKVVRTGGAAAGGGKLGQLVTLARQRVEELRSTLDQVLDQRDNLQDRVDELETILRNLKEQYNPNFNDEGVKGAVHAWEDYAAKAAEAAAPALHDADIHEILKEDSAERGVHWTEFETDDATDTDVLYSFEAYLPPFVRVFLHEKLAALRAWLIASGFLADNGSGSASAESPAVRAAREAFQKAESDLAAKQTALQDDEADLDKDYGQDDVFRAVQDTCLSTAVGEYDYELCWLGQATQKSKKGHGNTGLGRFARADVEAADEEARADGKSLGKGPRTVLRYENGQHCWNGPNRRTDVWLACAEKDEIWRVTEAEKCVYKMEVGTPLACEDEEPAAAAAAAGKDEL